MFYGCILLYLNVFIIGCLSYEDENIVDTKVLNVGEELWQETLPLQMGQRLYQLRGLKASMWYEVKISYPASIPTSFSIELKRGKVDLVSNMRRRLLNTEKLIFKADSDMLSSYNEVHVLVSAKPEGIVAKPHVQERPYIMFNIVCDELSLGIPHKAWCVGILVFLCMGFSFIIPYFVPQHVLTGSLAMSKTN